MRRGRAKQKNHSSFFLASSSLGSQLEIQEKKQLKTHNRGAKESHEM